MENLDGRILLCVLFSMFINYTDWKAYRIPNKAVLIFSALGMIVNIWLFGLHGAISSLIGGAIAAVLFPLFALRMLGAGDIKALMGIGIMLGGTLAAKAVLYSILGAGMLAFAVLLVRKNGVERLKYFYQYIKGIFLAGEVSPYMAEEKTKHDGSKFRFSFGITMGVMALAVEMVLKR